MSEQNKDSGGGFMSLDPLCDEMQNEFKIKSARLLYPDKIHGTLEVGRSLFDLICAFPSISLSRNGIDMYFGHSDGSNIEETIRIISEWLKVPYNQSDTDELTVGYPVTRRRAYITISDNLVVYSHSGCLRFYTNILRATSGMRRSNCSYTIMNIKSNGTITDLIHCFNPDSASFIIGGKGSHSNEEKENKTKMLSESNGETLVKLNRTWQEETAIEFIVEWFNKFVIENKFSAQFNELPSDLIIKALELGCKIKIKPCENASLSTGLYRLTIIPPKNEEYKNKN